MYSGKTIKCFICWAFFLGFFLRNLIEQYWDNEINWIFFLGIFMFSLATTGFLYNLKNYRKIENDNHRNSDII